MKKLTLSALAILLPMICANANPITKDNSTAFHGCLSKISNINHSPKGSSQLCLTDDNKFLIYGFGFMRVGTYQVDSQNQRIQLSFINPKELYIYSTYDPTVKGTHIQFDGSPLPNLTIILFILFLMTIQTALSIPIFIKPKISLKI